MDEGPWIDSGDQSAGLEVEDSDEEVLRFYHKPSKATSRSSSAKFHVQSLKDPARTACPKGGKIVELIMVEEDSVDPKEVCMTCLQKNSELLRWYEDRANQLYVVEDDDLNEHDTVGEISPALGI